MSCFSFFCPVFSGHPEARASAPKASGCIPEGSEEFVGRNRESRAAKLPGAGISPKQMPEKRSGRKRKPERSAHSNKRRAKQKTKQILPHA